VRRQWERGGCEVKKREGVKLLAGHLHRGTGKKRGGGAKEEKKKPRAELAPPERSGKRDSSTNVLPNLGASKRRGENRRGNGENMGSGGRTKRAWRSLLPRKKAHEKHTRVSAEGGKSRPESRERKEKILQKKKMKRGKKRTRPRPWV